MEREQVELGAPGLDRPGTLILDNGTSSGAFGGNLIIGDGDASDGGTVQLADFAEIPNDKAVVILSDGTLDLNGNNDTIGTLIIAGGKVTTTFQKKVYTNKKGQPGKRQTRRAEAAKKREARKA